MISNYVNTILGSDKKESSVKMSQESNSSGPIWKNKNMKNDIMLTKSVLLKSSDVAVRAKELLEQDDKFIQEQVNAYFAAFEELQSGGNISDSGQNKNTEIYPPTSPLQNKVSAHPKSPSTPPIPSKIARSSFSSTSEKYNNLPSEDRNFIKEKIQE